ncbi:hypothetical protein [Gorillibacterium massiliense]|uniref:hypothetical protein n=1 Tax=Gorillibacterium massiliense TaxID=1280390 RepID=UPI0004AF90BE|nr:hypothetical protein [Gorillibacterium massiliense]
MAEQNQIIQETLSISGYLLMKLFTKEKQEYAGFQAVNKSLPGCKSASPWRAVGSL